MQITRKLIFIIFHKLFINIVLGVCEIILKSLRIRNLLKK